MDFFVILFGHWVGDYLFQTSNMATQKHRSILWLLKHIAAYTAVITLLGIIVFSWKVGVVFGFVNGFLHFVTDFFSSKLSAKYYGSPRIFYPIIGFDQMVHMMCLYWTFVNVQLLTF